VAIVDSAVMNIGVQVSLLYPDFLPLGGCPEAASLDMAVFVFCFSTYLFIYYFFWQFCL
jgi:hypothetical protein